MATTTTINLDNVSMAEMYGRRLTTVHPGRVDTITLPQGDMHLETGSKVALTIRTGTRAIIIRGHDALTIYSHLMQLEQKGKERIIVRGKERENGS